MYVAVLSFSTTPSALTTSRKPINDSPIKRLNQVSSSMTVPSNSRAAGDSSTSTSGGTVSINGLLQLHPKHLEAELWRSPSAVR